MDSGITVPEAVQPRATRIEQLGISMGVVQEARRAAGCLDFAITADLLDPGCVNLFERWATQAAVETLRRSGPRNKRGTAML